MNSVRTIFAVFLALVVMPFALAQNVKPKVEIIFKEKTAKVGQFVEAKMKVTFADGLHAYQNPQPKDSNFIPVKVVAGKGVRVSEIKYPKGEEKVLPALGDDPIFLYGGEIIIPFKFEFTGMPETGKDAKVPEIIFSFQQCDDQSCFPPGKIATALKIKVLEGTPNPEPSPTKPTENAAAAGTTETPKAKKEGFAGNIEQAFETQNYLLIIPLMLLAGLVINLTPCVYPLVPVTISFFNSQAKSNAAGRLKLGLLYATGIAITYGLMGGIAAGLGGTFGQVFINPWFNIGLGVFMIVLALSMFDLYQIGLPPFISNQLKGRSGPVGALLMGALIGFGAAPCAGPVIVAIFTQVAKVGSVPFGVFVFFMVGLGLGLPYVALAAVTGSQKSLPKAGSWMKVVKAILGIVVLFFGLGYILIGLPQLSSDKHPLVYAAFFGLSAITLLIYERKSSEATAFMIKGIAILGLGFMMGTSYLSANKEASGITEMEFTKFTQESWDTAKASGKPIFVDIGANWCAECKIIEKNVLNTAAGVEATKDVIRLKIDHSAGTDQAYVDMTSKMFDVKGLPHLIFVKPGDTARETINELHSAEELKKYVQNASQ